METVTLSTEEIHALAFGRLRAAGADEANAGAVARNMTAAERGGSRSHGLFRLPGHVTSLLNGKANGTAQPRLEHLAPNILRVHGDLGYAPLAQETGLPALAEAAKAHGMAVLALTRVLHFAALWPETEWLAERGLVALSCTASPPYVAPHGGTRPFFGTNPMAFGWPRPGKPPMVFDQAAAAMARGEIGVHLRDGEPVPEGVGIDAEGRPTTDPEAILKGGAQLPFGGHKGSAIALMIDLLAGPLIGEVSSAEAGDADNKDGSAAQGGQFILALDPARLGAADPLAHGERVFERMLGIEGVRLPGSRREAARARADAEGVPVPKKLHDQIMALPG